MEKIIGIAVIFIWAVIGYSLYADYNSVVQDKMLIWFIYCVSFIALFTEWFLRD